MGVPSSRARKKNYSPLGGEGDGLRKFSTNEAACFAWRALIASLFNLVPLASWVFSWHSWHNARRLFLSYANALIRAYEVSLDIGMM